MRGGPGAGGGSGLKRLTGGSSSSKKYHKLGADDYDDDGIVKKGLTLRGFCKILYPFFLPSKGSDDSSTNRRRAVSTYLTLLLSKSANIISPLYISKATNALVAKNYDAAVEAIVIFSCLKFITVACKELQTILFIKIKQEASIELAEKTFAHVHGLSLNWHLTSKTGNVLRAIDRGTEATSQLVILIFLYLGPALLEALVVIIIFYTTMNQVVLGSFICVSIVVYSLITVVLTTYKKRNREKTNKMDNEYHDRAADSILNFE
jgi:ABC-type multidrug transport system fused ATPase/permease subunit